MTATRVAVLFLCTGLMAGCTPRTSSVGETKAMAPVLPASTASTGSAGEETVAAAAASSPPLPSPATPAHAPTALDTVLLARGSAHVSVGQAASGSK